MNSAILRVPGGRTALLLLAVLAVRIPAQALPDDVQKVLSQRVGRWEIRNDVLGDGGVVTRVEREVHDARFVLNGQIVEIVASIDGREDYRAFLLFDPREGRYTYSTIDRTNHHGDMTAERDAPYRFTSRPMRTPDGASLIFRLTLDSVEKDRMHGFAEASRDDGVTWRRVYNQSFTRVR